MIEGRIYRQIGIKYNLDTKTVKDICNSSYKFIRSMVSDLSTKDILLAGLFKFKMKPRYKKGYETATAESRN